jgi:hypothetical protein
LTAEITLEERPSSDDGGKGLKTGALGLVPMIAFYYALTGFACTWYYPTSSPPPHGTS